MGIDVQLAIVLGALAGLGLTLVIREFVPAHPDLQDALQRLATQRVQPVEQRDAGLQDRLGLALQRRAAGVPGLRVPTRELAILRIPAHHWLGEKALLGLLGLGFPPAATMLFAALGLHLPGYLPAGGSAVLGVFLFMVPSLTVAERATRAREEFARAVGAYIELVALERLGGTGTTQSMESAAEVGGSWAIERIREELLRAKLSGTTPWQSLADLSEELGVPELADLADIMRLAGEEGAQVYEALRARGRALRTQLLTAEHAKANAASEAMVVPVALLALVFVIMLAAPAGVRILG